MSLDRYFNGGLASNAVARAAALHALGLTGAVRAAAEAEREAAEDRIRSDDFRGGMGFDGYTIPELPGGRVNWTEAADMPHDETPLEQTIAAMRKADAETRSRLPEPPEGYAWHATLEFEGIDPDFSTRGADTPAFARITYRLVPHRDW